MSLTTRSNRTKSDYLCSRSNCWGTIRSFHVIAVKGTSLKGPLPRLWAGFTQLSNPSFADLNSPSNPSVCSAILRCRMSFPQGFISIRANSATIIDEDEEVSTSGDIDHVDEAESVPDWLDWRLVPGRVGPVKEMNATECPFGYFAFAVTGVLEGQQLKQNVISEGEEVIPLSEQQLLDCTCGARGCQEGFTEDGIWGLARLGGIESDQTYPFNLTDNYNPECRFNQSASVMTVLNHKILNVFPDEEKLKEAVATYGPLVVLIYKSKNFDNYKSGVFVDDSCPDRVANMPLLVVGYGTDPKEGDYWLLKTPYGINWGEFGYMRFARNRNNMCSITNFPSIATF